MSFFVNNGKQSKSIDSANFISYNIFMHIEKLKLRKLNNTRDLGGFTTTDGRKIKRGKLIRSGKLYKLPKSTQQKLKDIGLTTVVDMRMDIECIEYPTTVIEGVNYYRVPLVCTATTGITHEKSMARTMLAESKRIKNEFGDCDNYILKTYEIILFDKASQEKLKEFLDLVVKEEGCILWHCSAGKDRTGISAMLLESLLGVDEELIIDDYVMSDTFQRHKRNLQKVGLWLMPAFFKFKTFLFAQMAAKPQYISGAMTAIKQKYGSVTEYCKQALGVTDEDIQTLKNKYLE